MFPENRAAEEFVQAIRNGTLEQWKTKYAHLQDGDKFNWNVPADEIQSRFDWLKKQRKM